MRKVAEHGFPEFGGVNQPKCLGLVRVNGGVAQLRLEYYHQPSIDDALQGVAVAVNLQKLEGGGWQINGYGSADYFCGYYSPGQTTCQPQ